MAVGFGVAQSALAKAFLLTLATRTFLEPLEIPKRVGRRPGRRDEERKQFAALMRKVEVVRVRYGMTKTELAAELGANVDGVRAWMSGRTIGRRETVGKLEVIP